MSDAETPGSKYVNETGPGWVSTYRVSVLAAGGLRANLPPSVIRRLGAEPGDATAFHDRPEGVLLAAPPLDEPALASPRVTGGGQVMVGQAILLDNVGLADADDRLRVYEDDRGLLLVPASADPRVGGGSA